MRLERAEKRGRFVWDWLQWVQEKVDEIQTPLVGAKTKDNRERLCWEARAYGMCFEEHQGESKGQETARDHKKVRKGQDIKKQTMTQEESPSLSYQELVFKADYLYEKQAYVLAMKLYERCWQYAEDEVWQKILLVKIRRCGLAQ